jgi:hypothetical protein
MQFYIKNQDYITDTDMKVDDSMDNSQYASQHIPYGFFINPIL